MEAADNGLDSRADRRICGRQRQLKGWSVSACISSGYGLWGREPGLAQTWLSPVDGVIVRGDCVRVPGTGGPFANWQQRGELVTGRGIVPVGMRLTRGCVIRTGLLGVSLMGGSRASRMRGYGRENDWGRVT
jgi:hypothetical protein